MSYRSILSHLGPDGHCASRTQFAIQLARDLDCHLVGAAPTGVLPFAALVGLEQGTATVDLNQKVWEAMVAGSRRRVDDFRAACRRAGLKSFEALVDEADEAASIVRLAHCSDLIILGQADPDDSTFRQTQRLVEDVVLQSARPTLILPYAGRHASIGSSVLIAWDDSREATRAITDALPLLRCAEQVHVISWQEPERPATPSMAARLDALHRWLLWQGVTSDTHLEGTELRIADALLSRAADLNADLIVMGAYGHARWSERILGGATRGLLQSMTVPVLMSH
jgi:nucleotide-binding universal stress UspA family protein